jgi:hypothetical protein
VIRPVIVTGTVRFKEHTMTSTETGNEDHSSLTLFLEGTGVGQTTGRVWKLKEITRLTFNTPKLAAPHATETVRSMTHLIGPGAASSSSSPCTSSSPARES